MSQNVPPRPGPSLNGNSYFDNPVPHGKPDSTTDSIVND